MINNKLSKGNKIINSCYQQRISFCRKILKNVLLIFGIILLIVQLVKAFVPPVAQGVDANIIATSGLSIFLIAISLTPILNLAVSKFAARSRSRTFGIYLYFFPILFTALLLWAKIQAGHDSLYWQRISDEGGLSEYGTAIAYLLTAVFAYPIARQFWRQSDKFLAFLYYLLTLGSFFVSMEEISWGQRLIGFEEPEFWVEHNAQSEFTFHNLNFFHEHLLNQSFILIGFLGSFSWIVLHYWQKNRPQPNQKINWHYILPSWSISSFFYPTLIFYLIYEYTDGLGFFITKDQEHCEFIMSLGILVFVIVNFFRQGKERDSVLHKSKT